MLSNAQNLPPQVVKRVAKEMQSLVSQPIEGIQLSTEEETLAEITADIQGPEGTPYEGGTFRVKLVLGSNFPAQPPKGFFLTPIFHPNVDPRQGEICVNTLQRDWSSDHKLKHVLIVIRCLLIHPNPDSALNEEAGHLLHESYEEFFRRAQLFTNIHAQQSSRAQKENLSESPFLKFSTQSLNVLSQKKPRRTKRAKKAKKSKKTLRRL